MKENTDPSLDLRAMARQAMLDNGFKPDMPPEVVREAQQLGGQPQANPADTSVRDLRSLLWSSIDDSRSRDLDQVEYAERQADGDIRVMIGIADVDALVSKDSAINQHAAENGTTVYTGITIFPMLPEQLSTGVTSLMEGVDRVAMVIDLMVGGDGAVRSSDVYRATLHNRAQLAYESVGRWLEGDGPTPPPVANVAGMEDQIRLQVEATERLRALRQRSGALDLETIEASPVATDGKVVGIAVTQPNRARDILESFMVAANVAMAQFLKAKGWPSLRRVVRTPERWPRMVEIAERLGGHLPPEPDSQALADFLARRKAADPDHFPDLSLAIVKLMGPGEYVVEQPGTEHEGHFGLAVRDYTHGTAPNRRYADLVTQRLLKAVTVGVAAPYGEDELTEIAARCTEREDAARKVERQMRKVAAAVLLGQRIGETFSAVVTGVTESGTFVRLLAPPADGRVVRGEHGLDVGDKVRVRLLATEPARGFIDFEVVR